MKDLILGDCLAVLVDNRGKNPPFEERGIPAVSAMHVTDGEIKLEDARCVSREVYEKWMPTQVRRGDVVLTSEAPLGRVARIQTDDEICLAQRVFGLRGLEGVLDTGFLYYALQSIPVQSDLEGRATGTTVVGIRQSELLKVRIPAPEFREQCAIAEVLGALDDKIAANRKLMETADQLAVSLVRSAHTQDEYCELADVAAVTMGSSPPGDSYNEDGTGMVFYQGNRDFGFRSPSNRMWTDDPKRIAHAGDTMVSVRAPVGHLNVAVEETCIGRGLAAIRSTVGTPSVLYYRLKSAPGLWETFESGGTVFGSINGKELNSLKIPKISDEIVLEPQVSSLDRVVASADAETSQLADVRDALLPRLMAGELSVRDAEKAAEQVL